jgi:1-acyl-sn-glycerol-3-phosphate acyltransferase
MAEIVNLNILENLSPPERTQYFADIYKTCEQMRGDCQNISFIKRGLARLTPFFRKYPLKIEGTENIPADENVIFLCNHSNAHDSFTFLETFVKLHKNVSWFAAWDGLSWFSRLFFRLIDGVLIKRDDKQSISEGVMELCSRIIGGKSSFIFGEATWNMHPTKPMQNLHAGVTEIALITGKRIVPVLFEYVEVDHMCKKEAELYKKCVVSFGTPVTVKADESIFGQTDKLQEIMSSMREELLEREGIKKNGFAEDDIKRYINHTFLKKYKAFGFKYNTEWESQFLLTKGEKIENEYCLNADGDFVPGKIERNAIWK